jgi:opacity protein-like surface antigen
MPGRLGLNLSPQYSAIPFQSGSVLHVVDEALTWQDPTWGTFLPAAAQVYSNHEATTEGLLLDYQLSYFQMQWGKRFTDNLALGVNFNYGSSDLGFAAGPAAVSQTHSDAYNFRFGLLHRPLERLRWGVVFDYGFAPSRTTLYDFLNTGVGNVDVRDTGYQYLLRPGVAWEYQEDSALCFDYQLATFFDDSGSLYVNRFFVGVDHRVIKGFFVRSGVALDDHGSAAWAAGVGIYPSERLTLDLAYQYDMFPELHPELRRSQVLAASLGLVF